MHARYAIGSMGPSSEKANYTLWAIVPDDETVQRCLAAAEEIARYGEELGLREDHIVPWQGAYASTRLLGGDTRFTLGASGHIAGVINPPAARKRKGPAWCTFLT